MLFWCNIGLHLIKVLFSYEYNLYYIFWVYQDFLVNGYSIPI